MMCLTSFHVRCNSAGSWAIAFQKLLIESVLRVAMMSSYTALTSGLASLYSMKPNVAMCPPESAMVVLNATNYLGKAGQGVTGLFYGDSTQCVVQLIGATICAVWAFGLTFVVFKAVNR